MNNACKNSYDVSSLCRYSFPGGVTCLSLKRRSSDVSYGLASGITTAELSTGWVEWRY